MYFSQVDIHSKQKKRENLACGVQPSALDRPKTSMKVRRCTYPSTNKILFSDLYFFTEKPCLTEATPIRSTRSQGVAGVNEGLCLSSSHRASQLTARYQNFCSRKKKTERSRREKSNQREKEMTAGEAYLEGKNCLTTRL